ncbi:uncharacterized protein LOC105167606 [Sesamum indicum]|uniref:Uncharacterized protein LOC105167606 n=1 Tax=Sesamum indicum TaxID=4182 RepID=A0A6I9TQB5_SESIN|nr:uncharacterized protein LOC105167606 [Sesamum indicum]
MDETLMEIPVGDSVKISRKWKSKQRLKEQAVEKNGTEARDQIDNSLEASDKTSDYGMANNQSQMDLLETDLTLQPLDAGSAQNLSEWKAMRNKKKRLRKKMKKAAIKAEVLIMEQTDAQSTEDLKQGNATGNVDEAQRINQSKLDTGSTEHLVEENVTTRRKRKRKSVKQAKRQDEVQTVDQAKTNLLDTDLTLQPLGENMKMEADSTQNLPEGNATSNVDKIQSINQSKLDTVSTEHLVGGNVTAKRKKKRISSKAKSQDEVQSVDQAKMNLLETDLNVQPLGENPKMDAGSLQNLSEGNATGDVDEVQSISQSKLDTGSTEHPAVGNVIAKRKKKRKSAKAKSQDEVQSVDQTKMNLLETDLNVQPLDENPKMDAGSLQNLSEGNVTGNVDEVQSISQSKLDTGSTEHPAVGNVIAKRKKKRKSAKAKSQDEVQSVDQTKLNLLETDRTVQPLGENLKMKAGSMQNLSEGNATSNVDEVQSINQSKLDTGSTQHLVEGNVTAKRKKKRKSVKKAKSQDEVQSMDQTKMNLLETDLTVQPLGENPKMDAGSLQNLSVGNAICNVDEVQSINQSKLDTGSTEHPAVRKCDCQKEKEEEKCQEGKKSR